MAAKVLNFRRTRVCKDIKDGDYGGDGKNGTNGRTAFEDRLVARVDLDDDDRREVSVSMFESDYTGLIAEWIAGTATTLAESSVTTEIQAITEVAPAVKGSIRPDDMSSTQKTNLVGKAVTYPLP